MLPFRALVASFALLASFSVAAQQPRSAKVGIVTNDSPAMLASSVDPFRQRLRELGYAEGRNVAIEVRATAQPEQFRQLTAELVGLGMDVIVASGTAATRGAKEATSTVPIVMVSVGDAVAAGLVTSLARPGGNITGQTFMGPDIGLKGFDLLMSVFPRTKRVAALYSPEIPPGGAAFQAMRAAALSRGVALERIELRRPEDLDPALATMAQARPDALLAFAVRTEQLPRLVEVAARHRLPAVFGFREAVDAGGLMSYGAKRPELWRGAANYVDKILKGAKPGDLPVEQPTTFELVINLKAAKVLGITIPAQVLAQANDVIE